MVDLFYEYTWVFRPLASVLILIIIGLIVWKLITSTRGGKWIRRRWQLIMLTASTAFLSWILYLIYSWNRVYLRGPAPDEFEPAAFLLLGLFLFGLLIALVVSLASFRSIWLHGKKPVIYKFGWVVQAVVFSGSLVFLFIPKN